MVRAFGRQIFETAFFDDDKKVVSDLSPYKYIKYREADPWLDSLKNRVYNLMKREATHGAFGLTLKDVFQLDYAMFTELEEHMQEIDNSKLDVVEKELNKVKDVTKGD